MEELWRSWVSETQEDQEFDMPEDDDEEMEEDDTIRLFIELEEN